MTEGGVGILSPYTENLTEFQYWAEMTNKRALEAYEAEQPYSGKAPKFTRTDAAGSNVRGPGLEVSNTFPGQMSLFDTMGISQYIGTGPEQASFDFLVKSASGGVVTEDEKINRPITWGAMTSNPSKPISPTDLALGQEFRMPVKSLMWVLNDGPQRNLPGSFYGLLALNCWLRENQHLPLSSIQEKMRFYGSHMVQLHNTETYEAAGGVRASTFMVGGVGLVQNVWVHCRDTPISGCNLYVAFKWKRFSQNLGAYQAVPIASMKNLTDDDARERDPLTGRYHPGFMQMIGKVMHPEEVQVASPFEATHFTESQMRSIVCPTDTTEMGKRQALAMYFTLPTIRIQIHHGTGACLF